MSLFGKILAFLNVLGVAGVLALGLMTYAKKRAWQSACDLQVKTLEGIALDEQQLDGEGHSIFENQSEANVKTLLAGGPVVQTQVAEVERVHGKLQQATEQGDKMAQILALARAATPFTTDAGRYTDLVLIKGWLGDAQSRAALHAALKKAAAEAAVPNKADRPAGRSPDEAFREFVYIQGGLPKTPFVREYLKAKAAGPGQDFDKLYAAALDAIHAGLTAELENVYKAAKTGDLGDNKKVGSGVQKGLIVGYLYNAAPMIASKEEPYSSMTVTAGEWAAPAIKRIVAIVGLEVFPNVLIEQAARIGSLELQLKAESTVPNTVTSELVKQIERERSEFTAQHTMIIEYLKSQAAQVKDREDRLVGATAAADKQEVLVAASKKVNAELQKSMDDLRAQTLEYVASIRAMTKDFHRIQMKTRDASESLQRLESEIRRRERLAP